MLLVNSVLLRLDQNKVIVLSYGDITKLVNRLTFLLHKTLFVFNQINNQFSLAKEFRFLN